LFLNFLNPFLITLKEVGMLRKTFMGMLLIGVILFSVYGFLWASEFLKEDEARPAHLIDRAIQIPRGYGQLKAVSGTHMYFEAGDGTIRIVHQNPVGVVAKKVIIIGRN